KSRIAEKFPNKSIYGVTEITNSDEMFCVVNLEDAKTWTTVRIDATGRMTVQEKLQKSAE
ncbi:MAG TPA: hypothetical protein VFL47_04120, partial [Flavisolibacter sp.]|nr:hypothetical protein [Flavisolibacter sp.]